MLRSIISIISALILIFYLCESGEMVTNQYKVLDFGLSQCDWYSFPIRMQRSLVVFMSYTQQPVMIQGFANVRCIRDTFKKVNLDLGIECKTSCYHSFFKFLCFRRLMQVSHILWCSAESMDEYYIKYIQVFYKALHEPIVISRYGDE